MTNSGDFDVIIIGGSYAGLSAAMALGRSLREVLILDSGLPCNRQTPHSHNFITQDGEKPGVIAENAKAQVLLYNSVKFHSGIAVSGKKSQNGFSVKTEKGEEFTATKLIFATGIKDTMPDIPGFPECWGISVIHCPYCHGYEYRNKNTAIIANGAIAFHLASLVNNLTNKITILTNGKADFDAGQIVKLENHKMEIIETSISGLDHNQGQLQNVVFRNSNKIPFDLAYAAIPFTQHSDIPEKLGCEMTEQGYLKVDAFQKTTVPGVYACGDNSAMMRSVANAVYGGNLTGAVVNGELTNDQF